MKVDHEQIWKALKWFSFISCVLAFLWKVSDSLVSYSAKEVGTKIELKANYETDLVLLSIKDYIIRVLLDCGFLLIAFTFWISFCTFESNLLIS